MDPYEVLGVSYNSSWKEIRSAYKVMLHKTHPDKMGNSKFFDMVQDAYKSIKRQYQMGNNQQNYPVQDKKYNARVEGVVQKPAEQFDIHSFNQMFEQYASMYSEKDPYISGGYKIDRSLNYQEDIDVLKGKKINIPKQDLVIYKEPEALASSSALENFEHLGIDKINDYTCRNGTDYMRAYSTEADLIDDRTQYSSIDQLKQARANQSFVLTEEESRNQQKIEKKKKKLEQMRRQKVASNDKHYEKVFNYVQNRLK